MADEHCNYENVLSVLASITIRDLLVVVVSGKKQNHLGQAPRVTADLDGKIALFM
jgi:hypothetical protein